MAEGRCSFSYSLTNDINGANAEAVEDGGQSRIGRLAACTCSAMVAEMWAAQKL